MQLSYWWLFWFGNFIHTLSVHHIATRSLETYDFCPLRHGSIGFPDRNFTTACGTKPGQKPSKSVLLNLIRSHRSEKKLFNTTTAYVPKQRHYKIKWNFPSLHSVFSYQRAKLSSTVASFFLVFGGRDSSLLAEVSESITTRRERPLLAGKRDSRQTGKIHQKIRVRKKYENNTTCI